MVAAFLRGASAWTTNHRLHVNVVLDLWVVRANRTGSEMGGGDVASSCRVLSALASGLFTHVCPTLNRSVMSSVYELGQC